MHNKEVMVVDNNSVSKEAWQHFGRRFSFVEFLQLEENIGFGRANQFAINRAKGKYVFLLNPDTVLESDVCADFLDFMEQPANQMVGCCGAELYSASGKPVTSYGNFPTLFSSFASLGFYLLFKSYYYQKLSLGSANRYTQPTQVDYLSGAGWFARKDALDKVGGFDPAFFLYFEETELAWRLQQAGYQSWILPHIRFRHEEGGASGFNEESFNKIGYQHYIHSQRLFYIKTKGLLFACIAIPLNFLSMVLAMVLKGKWRELYYRMKVWFS